MHRTTANNLTEIFLQPGEHCIGDASSRIRTLLGSCVSITLWHPRHRIGAMSHFLLPNRGTAFDSGLDGRYGEDVMLLMLQKLAHVDVQPTECVGKIFGGGNMFPGQTQADARNIGQKNGEAARVLLHSHRIPIASESLFGIGHRQIIFDVSNGDVWARQVKPAGSPLTPEEQTA